MAGAPGADEEVAAGATVSPVVPWSVFLILLPKLESHSIYLPTRSFLHRRATGPDRRQDLRLEETDREDRDDQGDQEVDELRQELTDLELDAADADRERGDILLRRRDGGDDREDDVLGQGRKELGEDTRQVERSRQDDNIRVCEHL
jgi:hypothetical protein